MTSSRQDAIAMRPAKSSADLQQLYPADQLLDFFAILTSVPTYAFFPA